MTDTRPILEAIALKKCLRATYNRVEMKLAPHILYNRDDDLHMDAVALEKNGAPPKEKKLGVFRLKGLSDMQVLEEPFEAEGLFEPEAERYAGKALMMIEA